MKSLKPKTYNLTPSAGFSLLELLIYLSILSVVMLLVGGSFFSLSRGRGQIEARGEVNSNIRFALLKMKQDIEGATSVLLPASPGETGATLSLDLGGQIILYCVFDGVLRRDIDGGVCDGASESLTASTTEVTTILFERVENINLTLGEIVTSVGISLSARYAGGGPDYEYTTSRSTTASVR